MKVDDLAALLGKTREEVEAMLNCEEPISLSLTEKRSKKIEPEEGCIKLV